MIQKDTLTIIWFTGVLSQYDVSTYDIENLKINHKLLEKIKANYGANKYVAIICYVNDEKEKYLKLLEKENLLGKDIVFAFVDFYNFCVNTESFYETLNNIINTYRVNYAINYYIDCDRKRLTKIMNKSMEPNKLIHLSQLLD